jgi:hypothetical protein
MKNLLFKFSILIFLFSCSKDETTQIRELKISYKSTKSIGDFIRAPGIIAYPNPFNDLVILNISGPGNYEILISDDKGGMKKIQTSDSNTMLDFKDEKSGAYYCEVLINNIVYKTYLIKE